MSTFEANPNLLREGAVRFAELEHSGNALQGFPTAIGLCLLFTTASQLPVMLYASHKLRLALLCSTETTNDDSSKLQHCCMTKGKQAIDQCKNVLQANMLPELLLQPQCWRKDSAKRLVGLFDISSRAATSGCF